MLQGPGSNSTSREEREPRREREARNGKPREIDGRETDDRRAEKQTAEKGVGRETAEKGVKGGRKRRGENRRAHRPTINNTHNAAVTIN